MSLRRFSLLLVLVLCFFGAVVSCSDGKSDRQGQQTSNADASDASVKHDSSIVDSTTTDVVNDVVVNDVGYNWWPPSPGPLVYNGGPIMKGIVNVYFVWYGSWTTGPRTKILEDLVVGLSGSPYSQLLTDYYERPNVDAGQGFVKTTYATGKFNLVGSTYLGYTHGTALYSGDVEAILTDALQRSLVPYDENGVYFVMISSDVSEISGFSSFCGDYCGWHDDYNVNGKSIKLAFIGDPSGCLQNCTVKSLFDTNGVPQSPHNDWGIDSMASVIVHELFESVSDPLPMGQQKAWQDQSGFENGDMCAWRFEPTFKTSNGLSRANISVGGQEYLIQQMWVFDDSGTGSGYCSMQK